MASNSNGTGDLEFLQALLKRGFINIPRMLFDYTGDLILDYDTLGRVFAVLACLGGPTDSSFGPYTVTRRNHPRDFDQLCILIDDLEQKDIVRVQMGEDEFSFSFIPLYSRVRVLWDEYREQHETEAATNVPYPAVAAAEKLLGRTLSEREVETILDWMNTYDFDQELILAVCREGLNQGVTRMSYLNQIALQWHEAGVRTPEDAEAHAQRHRKSVAKHKVIIQYLGLKRLTGAEQALIDKWTTEWGFSNEVIIRASAEAVGSNNPLQYINKILESWVERGVKTVADAEKLLSEHKRKSPQETAARSKKTTAGSNVFLRGEKKDDKYYDHVYKPFGD